MGKNREREQERIGFFHMTGRIYQMCRRANLPYFIFNQASILSMGLVTAGTVVATQLFFDSVYGASVGANGIKSAVLFFLLYIAAHLLSDVLDSVMNYSYNVQYMRVLGYMKREINLKSAQIDPIRYEDPRCLDEMEKCEQGAACAMSFYVTASLLVMFYLPYLAFMALYLHHLKPALVLCLAFAFVPVLVSHVLRSSVFSELEDKAAPLRRKCSAYYEACCGKEYGKETRTTGSFRYFKQLLTDAVRSLNDETWRAKKRSAAIDMILKTVSLAGYGSVLFLLIRYLLAGEISVGAFGAVFASVGTLFAAMDQIVNMHLKKIADNFGQICNFIRFLEIPTGGKRELDIDRKQPIVAEKAGFRYPNAKEPSLEDIDLTIQPGEILAIVGENGAGKTTLARLLIGLYQATSGKVRIGGTDLSEASYRARFRNVSGVFQRYQKYALTLRDNIRISDFGHGDEGKIPELLSENHINYSDKMIYPDGLDTMLSREFDGVELSGGQWQRIAIARGFYRDSEIMILDEPTASIDPIEESAIYEKFAEAARGKTAIIITHRMASARMAHRIIVMQRGRIVETGSHQELMQKKGVYEAMYTAQAKWYR